MDTKNWFSSRFEKAINVSINNYKILIKFTKSVIGQKKKKLINLLILGSTGQLGAEIYKVLEKKKILKFLTKRILD